MNLVVREAAPEDAASIVHLGALMYASVGAPASLDWIEASTTLVSERLGTDLFGAVIDDGAGGLAACGLINVVPRLPRPGRHARHAAYIQWVSTAPEFHRRGYATAVMDALLAWTDARGIEVIELHATHVGRHLYEELGFFIKTDNVAMMAIRGDAAAQVPEVGE